MVHGGERRRADVDGRPPDAGVDHPSGPNGLGGPNQAAIPHDNRRPHDDRRPDDDSRAGNAGMAGEDSKPSDDAMASGDGGPDEAIARAKARLRRTLAACRNGTGPRPGPGVGMASAGSWPTAGPGPGQPLQTGSRETAGGSQIARQVLALPEVAQATRVVAFASLPGEPSTLPLLDALRAQGARVLLPVLRADLDLDFREYTGTLVPGALGTREPPPAAAMVDLADADVVLVPAVAVDPLGHRLGRGGGSYDRALLRMGPTATLIAVVDDHAIVEAVPVAEHDLPVAVIVTPTRLVRCG
jgi:5-formyltetrahydrofolate cyclo-ligase